MKKIVILFFLLISVLQLSAADIITGAEQTDRYLSFLKGKRVALFSNQTGIVGNKHVLDVLLENGVNVVVIFSPEHGFRGTADAGEKVNSSIDTKTGVPICSLYGIKGGIPDVDTMKSFDVLVSDIQDVGLRFYTYYITMGKLMNQCAIYDKQMIVLDRPNPNGFYVAGPILDMKYKSGVGSLPVPVVHGLTLGELALMANGEHWLESNKTCNLIVIACQNYTHQSKYALPVAPSPNLPNMKSIYLYPSLCYFEATFNNGSEKTDPNKEGLEFRRNKRIPKKIEGLISHKSLLKALGTRKDNLWRDNDFILADDSHGFNIHLSKLEKMLKLGQKDIVEKAILKGDNEKLEEIQNRTLDDGVTYLRATLDTFLKSRNDYEDDFALNWQLNIAHNKTR